MDVLRQQFGHEKTAFFEDANLIVAVNQEVTDRHCALEPGDEVALFPPVTGG
ncbi:MAG: MoaD/ThiS family protein [Pseudomonadales bacterium]|nr:MoaD/ThiS family protein [Pseudomonadales bacterium]